MVDLQEMGKQAVAAKYLLQKTDTERKNEALKRAAQELIAKEAAILQANEKDVSLAEANGMSPGLVDRLKLTQSRIELWQRVLGRSQTLRIP